MTFRNPEDWQDAKTAERLAFTYSEKHPMRQFFIEVGARAVKWAYEEQEETHKA